MNEYKIVQRGDVGDLEKQVNNMIKEGWKPHGDMSVDYRRDIFTATISFIQPMIRDQ